MGESGLPADHRLTGGRSAQINGRPGRPIPLPHGKNRPSAARMGIIGAWPAGVWRRRRWLTTPGAAFDAEREPRAHGPGLARGGQRRRSTREGAGPTARPFCKSFLLETALAADGSGPQTPGGGLLLALAADVPAAFPAGVWRQRSETFIGHRASGAQRLLTPVALWLSKQVQNRFPHMCASHTYVLACMYETFC